MNALTPLESLYDTEQGNDLPLPPELLHLYGHLSFPSHPDRPYVIANFVTSMDGVVTLDVPGHSGGGDISGFNKHDKMVMGLLRAIADAVIVGAGTLRIALRHRWTAQYIYPPLAEAYLQLRTALGKSEPPLNVLVTASGNIQLNLPLFQSGEVPVLIVTTADGLQRLHEQAIPPPVQILAVQNEDSLTARDILKAVNTVRQSEMILLEGGPKLMGNFFAEKCLDELFLTFSPQIAGREEISKRPGLVTGKTFAPEHPLWGTLLSVKRASSHLFLRYGFETKDEDGGR